MKTETIPLSELNRRAVAALTREIGVVGTIRFLSQYTQGAGDYTSERRSLLPDVPLDELIEQARKIDERKNV